MGHAFESTSAQFIVVGIPGWPSGLKFWNIFRNQSAAINQLRGDDVRRGHHSTISILFHPVTKHGPAIIHPGVGVFRVQYTFWYTIGDIAGAC